VKAQRLEAYFKAHPEYASAARPLILANSKAAFLRKGAYIRIKTHCVNGHSFAEHGRTAMHKGWMTRQCRACEVMRHQRGGVMKAEVLEKVTARISVTRNPIDSLSYPPRGMSRDEAARYVGVGATKFDEMVADGRMPRPKRVDGRVIWDRLRIEAAFSDLPEDTKANPLDRILNGGSH
jgi:predicted DNA-binding transcriptional regulator AlpA